MIATTSLFYVLALTACGETSKPPGCYESADRWIKANEEQIDYIDASTWDLIKTSNPECEAAALTVCESQQSKDTLDECSQNLEDTLDQFKGHFLAIQESLKTLGETLDNFPVDSLNETLDNVYPDHTPWYPQQDEN